MKKYFLFLTIFALFFSSEAKANQWVLSSTASDGGMDMYLDPDSLREFDGYIYVWKLLDFVEPLDDGSMSVKMYSKINCSSKMYQDLNIIFYPEDMAKGTPNYREYEPLDWVEATSGSIVGFLVESVCDL